MTVTLEPGDYYVVTQRARHNGLRVPSRAEVAGGFAALDREYVRQLGREGVEVRARGAPLTSPPQQLVQLTDGSWERRSYFELVTIAPWSPHASGMHGLAAVPILIPLAILAAIFAATVVVALVNLEEIERTISKVGDAVGGAVERTTPALALVAVIVLAVVVLRST